MMVGNKNQRILIIEDDKDIIFTLREFLESEGYEVQTAANGQEALEILQAWGAPNLILLDMRMPVMNGWEFAGEFLNRYDHLAPILVMTAAADAKQRAQEIHATSWVGKPFELDDLLTKIKLYAK